MMTLLAALLMDWVSAPEILPKGLAILVGTLAVVFFAAGGRKRFERGIDPETGNEKSWIAYELAGQGTPSGFYPLVFFGIVTIVLTGVVSPYSLPAWSAFCLGIAWGRAGASYPVDDE